MSIVDFTKYQPPGVYIEEDVTPLVSVLGVQPTVVAIVGPSVGYRTRTEAVTLNDTTPVELVELGIAPASVTVAASDGTAYASTDFNTVVGGGADANTGTLPDNTLTIARSNASTIPNGDTVYVTYHFTDATYHTPQRFQDYDDVKDAFGQPLDLSTGEITSPLSLAAKVCFENGASQVVCVATTDANAGATTRAHLTDGYAKLAAFDDVNLLVPLPVGLTGGPGSIGDLGNVGADLKSQVEDDARNTLFRVGVLGFETTVTADPVADLVSNFRSSRVMLAWPNRLSFYIGEMNQNIEVGGYYLAAAYAGNLASRRPQIPLTKKQIRGFSGIPGSMLNTMSKLTKNTWSGGGVAVTELTRQNTLECRHGLSTDPSSVNTREISLTRARDSMVDLLQGTIENAALIGSPIDENTLIAVKGVVSGALETAKSTGLIFNYLNIKARQASTDPSVIEIKFQYKPSYPLNYIVIVFSIDTTTGEVTPIEDSSSASTTTP